MQTTEIKDRFTVDELLAGEAAVTEKPAAVETQAVDAVAGETLVESKAAEPLAVPVVEAEPLDILQLFDGQDQRAVQQLRMMGILQTDEQMVDVGAIKRIQQVMRGDFANDGFQDDTGTRLTVMQAAFKERIKTTPLAQLIDNGDLNALVVQVLNTLADYHSKAAERMDITPQQGQCKDCHSYNKQHAGCEKDAKKYRLDAQYYQNHPDVVRSIAAKYKDVLASDRFLNLGELVVEMGFAGEDRAKARDKVDDALTMVSAHRMNIVVAPFKALSPVARTLYKENPDTYQVQIDGLAETLKGATKPLAKSQPQESATPQLAKVQALHSLASAQINAALSWQPSSPDGKRIELSARSKLEILEKAQALAQDYQRVALSLAHHFLGEGAAKDEPAMKKLREQLGASMSKQNIALLPAQEAEAKAKVLAEASVQDLLQISTGKPLLEKKLALLARQADASLDISKMTAKPQLIGTDAQAIVSSFTAYAESVTKALQTLVPANQVNVTRLTAGETQLAQSA